ncbi:MAG: metal-dependent transcriptional regulator [Endomicrobiales bacterium]
MKSKKWMDIEEALGVIWNFRERGGKDTRKLRETLKNGISDQVFQDLLEHDLVQGEGDAVELTPQGEDIGRDVTRRHRLAERLLADVIEVQGDDLDKNACEFEHIISAGVTDAICTLLGHPKVCPHGSPIPQGQCCKKAQEKTGSIVIPLDRLPVGEQGTITYIVTSQHPHLHKLLSMGMVPGAQIHLHQRSPSYVVKINETEIALDGKVAGQIYVRRR